MKTEMFLLIALGIIYLILGIIILCRLKILNSNEAIVLVLVLFGNYYGTIYKEGEDTTGTLLPATNKKVYLKLLTLIFEYNKINLMKRTILSGVLYIL